jgi:hypothetical protein
LLSVTVWPVWATPTGKLSFSPEPGISTEVVANGPEVSVAVKEGNHVTTEKIEVETEKRLALAVDDYNFDGYPDFSISHLDDGMGTYTVYQVYVYSPKTRRFKLLAPGCGDEFLNLVVSSKDRLLTNSYFADNQVKTCTMKF